MMLKIKIISASILIVLLIIGYFIIYPYFIFITKTLSISLFKTLITSVPTKSIDGRVSIVLLGIAGGIHDGPNLSDSISVLQYDFKTNSLISVGIPRDLWSGTIQDKINSAYAYGEAKQTGGGLKLAKAEVGGLLGTTIQYAVLIDFAKFKELIDGVDGIDINVEHSFTDHDYPIDGKEDDLCGGDPEYRCRYETLHFKTGSQHMNGATALKFVRSRHAVGDEGSDFARNKRQQLVVNALKNKVIKVVKSQNMKEITRVYNLVNSLVARDISNQDLSVSIKNALFKKNFVQYSFNIPQFLLQETDYDDY
ncbi:hypothetical protein HGB07_00425 [Candidatus Roizmanbacteria bacterium]|nr:hypothetical protein [Candidatus Roizmanbacteria bacterium]